MNEKSLFEKWKISPRQLTDLVEQNPSLRGIMLGYVAELKFQEMFLSHEDITTIQKDDDHDRKRKGDRRITYKGKEFIVEVKSLQTNTVKNVDNKWTGKAQVDGSDKRIVRFSDGTTLSTTLLKRGEFDLLAINCFAFGGEWKFVFAGNEDLPCSSFKKYTEEQRCQLIASLIPVEWPPVKPFTDNPFELLDEMILSK